MTYHSVAMEMLDPERERRRLRDEYSRMIDGELELLAADESDLTELARGVLREEVLRRGLSPPGSNLSAIPRSGAEVLAAPSHTLYVVRRFASFSEALIAKSCLDGSGIKSVLADENVLGANPFLSLALGGVRLFVSEIDLEQATEVLDGSIPEGFEVQGMGTYVQPRCPQCFSMDITFGELGDIAKVSLPLGLPLPLRREEWHCHHCGCRWTDSNEE